MAHYLAERLQAAETLTGAERAAADSEVAELIVQLWRHRAGVLGADPLQAVTALARAVQRLGRDRPEWGYFQPFGAEPPPAGMEQRTAALLQAAQLLDRAAGDAVRALLRRAATTAAEADAPWVEAVRAADAESLGWLDDLLAGAPPRTGSRDEGELLARVGEAIELLRPPAAPGARRWRRLAADVSDHPPGEGEATSN